MRAEGPIQPKGELFVDSAEIEMDGKALSVRTPTRRHGEPLNAGCNETPLEATWRWREKEIEVSQINLKGVRIELDVAKKTISLALDTETRKRTVADEKQAQDFIALTVQPHEL